MRLLRQDEVVLVGPVRQEILSGIRGAEAFERLRMALRVFPDEGFFTEDYEEAARVANTCRAAGVAGSSVDYLLCGAALRRGAAVYTTDLDFVRYAQQLPLRLHVPEP